MQKTQFSAGTVIFSQGDSSREIYILNKGVIEVLAGGNVVAKISQRGAFFGEMAAILKEERNATLRAQTDCNCIVIYEEYIDAVIKSAPEIGFALVRLLAKRLKHTTSMLSTRLKEEEASPQFKNVYQLMVAMKMLSKQDIKNALELMKEDANKKSFIVYLKKLNLVDEKDVVVLSQLFKKYQ